MRTIKGNEFFLLRNSRDIIKAGSFRLWNEAPAAACPVMDRFYRNLGLRGFANRATQINLYGVQNVDL